MTRWRVRSKKENINPDIQWSDDERQRQPQFMGNKIHRLLRVSRIFAHPETQSFGKKDITRANYTIFPEM